MIESSKYVRALVAKRAVEPRDNFTSNLLQARASEVESLTQSEGASLIFGLLTAAHETTTSLLANGFGRSLTERAAWEEICRDPALIIEMHHLYCLRCTALCVVAKRHDALPSNQRGRSRSRCRIQLFRFRAIYGVGLRHAQLRTPDTTETS